MALHVDASQPGVFAAFEDGCIHSHDLRAGAAGFSVAVSKQPGTSWANTAPCLPAGRRGSRLVCVAVLCVSFDADGAGVAGTASRRLAWVHMDWKLVRSGGATVTVRLRCVRLVHLHGPAVQMEGGVTCTQDLPHAGVGAVSLRPDQRVVATAGWDGATRLWRWRSRKRDCGAHESLAVLRDHTGGAVYTAAFRQSTASTPLLPDDGRGLLATGGKDGHVLVYSMFPVRGAAR